MTDAQETPLEDQVAEGTAPEEVLEGSVEPARNFRGQAAHDAARRERKARAAVTVKANAEAAEKAKRKAQAKQPAVKGAKSFADKAKAIEKKIADAHEAKLKAEAEK